MINNIMGIPVILNPMLTKGTKQLRTHRKKRINKKWKKRYGFISIPDPRIYVINPNTNIMVGFDLKESGLPSRGTKLVMHPKTWEILSKNIPDASNYIKNALIMEGVKFNQRR